jgi:hypothetical protein
LALHKSNSGKLPSIHTHRTFFKFKN